MIKMVVSEFDYTMVNYRNGISNYQIDVLSAAIIGANEENVELLRNEGMDWQRDGVDGGDVWIAACHAGQTDSVNILLEKDFAPTNEEIVYDLKVVMI